MLNEHQINNKRTVFGFRLTIQNTANWHVSNAFDLLSVFISFPLARCAPHPIPPPLFWGGKYQKKENRLRRRWRFVSGGNVGVGVGVGVEVVAS
jgi:hypothetical protein